MSTQSVDTSRGPASRLATLHEMNAIANSALPLETELQRAAELVAHELEADLCAIWLFSPSSHELILHTTNGPRPRSGTIIRRELGEGYSGWVAKEGAQLVEEDALAHEGYREEAESYPTPYRGLLAMPIIFFPEPHLIGVISVQTERPRRFTDEEISFLEVLTGQLALSILNGRLFIDSEEKGRRQLMDLRTLERISAQVASSLDREGVANAIVEQAVSLSGADAAVLLERDETAGELRPVASHALDDVTLSARSLARSACCAVRAASTGKPVTGQQCNHRDGACVAQLGDGTVDDLRVTHCQPLATMVGPIGALCVFTRDARGLDARALMLIGTFANVAAITMENARLFARITRELDTQVALRRELEHRINNSLTALRHLIRNRGQRATTREAKELFSELISQVEGLIEINRLLSRSDEMGGTGVQAGELVRTIVDIIKRQLIPAEMQVSFTIGKIPGVMAYEPATVFGIVINELVANALEHGFEGRQHGTIRIHGALSDGRVRVRVADDGAGLPEGFTVAGQANIGLTLVRQLVQNDLHGSITIYCMRGDPASFEPPDATAPSAEEWTVAELEFPAELRGVERRSHLGIGKPTI